MQTFRQYIQSAVPKRTHAEWACLVEVSRSHMTEIINGTKRPGRNAMLRINEVTEGAVPPAVWFENTTEATE